MLFPLCWLMIAQNTPNIATIDRAILDRRKSITSIELTLHIERISKDKRTKCSLHLWQEKEKYRTNLSTEDAKLFSPTKQVYCYNFDVAGSYFIYGWPEKAQKPVAASVDYIEKMKNAAGIVDARKLGLVMAHPLNMRAWEGQEGYFEDSSDKTVLGKSSIDGIECINIVQKKDVYTIQVDVDSNNLVRSMKYDYPAEKESKLLRYEYNDKTLIKYGMPSHISLEEVDGDSKLTTNITLESATINKPFAFDPFQLTNMDLPEGTPITGFKTGDMMIKNGKLAPCQKPIKVRPPGQ